MARSYFGDIAIWSADGGSLLGAISDINFEVQSQTDEGGAIAYLGESPQITKMGPGTFSTTVMSNKTGGRVTNLDVSALTLNAVSYDADLVGGSFSGSYTHDNDDADMDVWAAPSVTNLAYKGDIELLVPAAAAQAIAAAFFPTTAAEVLNLYFMFSFTINGVAITLPVVGKSFAVMADYGKNQKIKVAVEGRNLLAGAAYPTAPTGTASLLAKAFNAPRTQLTYDFKTAATNGHRFTGSMIWNSFDISFNNREITKTKYGWTTTGQITYAVT